MTDYLSEQARRRDAAARLRDLLREVREAKPDARSFALFEKRDDLAALGIPHERTDAFDANDDAALNRHIAQAAATARALGADDEWADMGGEDVSVTAARPAALPPAWTGISQRLNGMGEAFGRAANKIANVVTLPRESARPFNGLPKEITLDLPREKQAAAAARAHSTGREVVNRVVRKPGGRLDMVDEAVGKPKEAFMPGMSRWYSQGLDHTHENTNGANDNNTHQRASAGGASGADLYVLNSGTNYSIANQIDKKDGDNQSMFLRTDETNFHGRNDEILGKQLYECAGIYYAKGKSWDESTKLAGRDLATFHKAGYYRGQNNHFVRQDPSLGECGPLFKKGPRR